MYYDANLQFRHVHKIEASSSRICAPAWYICSWCTLFVALFVAGSQTDSKDNWSTTKLHHSYLLLDSSVSTYHNSVVSLIRLKGDLFLGEEA